MTTSAHALHPKNSQNPTSILHNQPDGDPWSAVELPFSLALPLHLRSPQDLPHHPCNPFVNIAVPAGHLGPTQDWRAELLQRPPILCFFNCAVHAGVKFAIASPSLKTCNQDPGCLALLSNNTPCLFSVHEISARYSPHTYRNTNLPHM